MTGQGRDWVALQRMCHSQCKFKGGGWEWQYSWVEKEPPIFLFFYFYPHGCHHANRLGYENERMGTT